jgi:hypothetical protein
VVVVVVVVVVEVEVELEVEKGKASSVVRWPCWEDPDAYGLCKTQCLFNRNGVQG